MLSALETVLGVLSWQRKENIWCLAGRHRLGWHRRLQRPQLLLAVYRHFNRLESKLIA